MRVNVSPKGGQGGTPLPLTSLYICIRTRTHDTLHSRQSALYMCIYICTCHNTPCVFSFSHNHNVFSRFPSTQVQVLKLTNPSRHPVMIQPVLLHYYPQPQRIVQVLFESGSIENTDFSRSESAFSLDPDTWGYDTSLTSHLLVPSGGKEEMEVRVTFLARDSRLSSTLLILRNNLTALEYVVIHGRGLEGQFSIDGVHPDTSSLLFQFSPSDLEKCEGKLQEEKNMVGGAVTYVRWGGAVTYVHVYAVGRC